jgi:choline dehydrogenase-like flavoprotein
MNLDLDPTNTFDAIVIGSGISGSWAAKELCEQGLKTLVLERGRDVKHVEDYPTAMADPWNLPNRGENSAKDKAVNPVVNRCYAYDEGTAHFFVKDQEHPYQQEKPFDWVRGYQIGGKSLIWARQTQRWSRFEFENPARDNYAKWPIGYDDIADWYSYVEKFVGISGNKDGLESLPDGEFLPAWQMNKAEKVIASKIKEAYTDRDVIIGRCAHLTEPQPIHLEQGRAQCQARHLCYRGCPFGGYFSANASTLPWATKTGNLTVKSDTVVHSIIYDNQLGKAVGVKVIDKITKMETSFFAKVIFVNAATLNTNLILLNSKSERFPNGLGNDNGLLGKYISFHNYRGSITATLPGHLDSYYYGRRPTSVMIPNFKNKNSKDSDFDGGYMTFFSTSRISWNRDVEGEQIGAAYKQKLSEPGGWFVYMMMQGETIPRIENHVKLSNTKVDAWGIPQLVTSVDYHENDFKMLANFLNEGTEMLRKAGCENIATNDSKQAPGLDIHEMGGVRMGSDPNTSLLNEWNQMHSCKNVFVTDGACMASTGVQNPSLTFMAITARAANYAANEFKNGRL